MRHMKKVGRLPSESTGYLFVILMLLPTYASAISTQSLRDFANSKRWLRALHYAQDASGFKSRIDQADFFLTETGKTDPYEELIETIHRINHREKWRGEYLSCTHPYRYRLVTEAGLASRILEECPRLNFFKEDLGNDGISIVFVSQYADNPSSIMGHLFLQFSNHKKQVEGRPVHYLNHTVNYAAGIPTGTSTFNYVISGITGGFFGHYTLYQFSDMIEKYNNAESRDLFSYQLDLTPHEIELTIEHVWELLEYGAQEYYFFDENCAFQVLAIIEAIKPNFGLTAKLPFYTTPIDVLKIIAESRLIRKVLFTPSLFQRISDKKVSLTADEQDQYDQYLSHDIGSDQISKPLVAELLIDQMNFDKHESHGKIKSQEKKRYFSLLLARSKLGESTPAVNHSEKVSPHLSHGSSRLSVGYGRNAEQGYSMITFRPAIHDLYSRPDGYQRHSAFEFFTMSVRLYQEEKKPTLDYLQLLNIGKLTGLHDFSRFAWHFDYKLKNRFPGCQVCLQPHFFNGIGFSREVIPKKLDFYLLGSLNIRPYIADKAWRAGIGLKLGAIYAPFEDTRLISSGERSINHQGLSLDQLTVNFVHDFAQNIDLRITMKQEFLDQKSTQKENTLNVGYSF